MVFGRKGRKIEKLEGRLAACAEHARFIPLAEEIGRQAAAQAARVSNMEAALDTILAAVQEGEKRRILLENFNQLPIERRLAMLLTHFTDEETRQVLEAERSRLVGKDATERAIKTLRQECKDSGRINLANVPKGARIKIGLYDIDDLQAVEDPCLLRDEYEAARIIGAASLGGGSFQVLSDYIDFGTPRLSLSIHQSIRLGGSLLGDPETAHYAYYGAGLNCLTDEATATLNVSHGALGLGYVEVNGQEVMGGDILPDGI